MGTARGDPRARERGGTDSRAERPHGIRGERHPVEGAGDDQGGPATSRSTCRRSRSRRRTGTACATCSSSSSSAATRRKPRRTPRARRQRPCRPLPAIEAPATPAPPAVVKTYRVVDTLDAVRTPRGPGAEGAVHRVRHRDGSRRGRTTDRHAAPREPRGRVDRGRAGRVVLPSVRTPQAARCAGRPFARHVAEGHRQRLPPRASPPACSPMDRTR